MARITVEDCLVKIPNRFQLVLAATYRARMLSQGHAPKVETKNKPGVTALREIAAGESRHRDAEEGPGLSGSPPAVDDGARSALNSGHGCALIDRRARHQAGAAQASVRAAAHPLTPGDAAAASFAALTGQARLPRRRRHPARPRRLPLRRRSAPRPVPRLGRALHHAPDRRRGPVRRVEARRAGDHGRADARRDGGLRHQQGRADRALRRADRRPRRRPHQARQAALLDPRGVAGRVVPQDAARDDARRPRHPGQARRPAAQHAHDGRGRARQAGRGSPPRRSRSTRRSRTGSA